MSDLLNKASLVMIPSGYKATKVYSEIPTDGSGDLSFTRASNGTRVNSAGVIETKSTDVPRLTYQNGGGGCPSLLLEKQSTNVITYSEQFDNAAWTKNVSVTANAITSPDGTQNADKILESASNVQQWAYQSPSMTGAQTATIYAKKGERNYIAMATAGLDPSYFNLDTGVVVSTASGATASIESVGNGWYRCSVSSASIVGGTFFIVWISYDGINRSYAGDSSKGVYIWGAQNEASSYPTSYIPTTSSSATRVADACYKTGISSLIGQTEGVIFVDAILTHDAPSNEYLIQVSANGSNRFFIYREGSTNKLGCFSIIGGTPIYTQLTAAAITGRVKAAFAYSSGSFAFYVNGIQVGTSSATFGTPASMGIFNIDSNDGLENGFYKYNEAILFKTRLTNAELASLTTI